MVFFSAGVFDPIVYQQSNLFSMASLSAIKLPSAELIAEKSLDSNLHALATFVGMSGEQLAKFASLLEMPVEIEALKGVKPRCFVGMAEGAVDAVIATMEGGLYNKSLAKQVYLLGKKIHTEDPPPPTTASPR